MLKNKTKTYILNIIIIIMQNKEGLKQNNLIDSLYDTQKCIYALQIIPMDFNLDFLHWRFKHKKYETKLLIKLFRQDRKAILVILIKIKVLLYIVK